MQPNQESITIADITDWVIANRTGKAFLNWTRDEIGSTLYQAYLSKSLVVAFDKDDSNTIIGIVHGTAFPKEKVFHVANMLILPNHPEVIPLFLNAMDEIYPEYTLEGQRFGKIKHYDTPRFKRHVRNLNN